jgi:hypothetical protein
VPQLASRLREQKRATPFADPTDYVFVTGRRTPLAHRHVERRALQRAAGAAGLNIYTHLFDDARHTTEIRTRMPASPFARLLEPDGADADNIVVIARRPPRHRARRRRGLERSRT